MAKYTLREHPRITHYTYLHGHFQCFQGKLEELDWIVANPEFNYSPAGMDYPWKNTYEMNGKELQDKFGHDSKSSPQIIWGTFLGFEKGKRPNLSSVENSLHSAKRIHSLHPQHPNAKIEINCIDSSLTEVYTDDDNFSKMIENYWQIKKDVA